MGNGGLITGVLIGSALVSIITLAALTIISGGLAGAALTAFIALQLAPLLAVAISNINNFLKIADPDVVTCFWTGFAIGVTAFSFIAGIAGSGNIVSGITTVIGLGLMYDANKTGTTGFLQCK